MIVEPFGILPANLLPMFLKKALNSFAIVRSSNTNFLDSNFSWKISWLKLYFFLLVPSQCSRFSWYHVCFYIFFLSYIFLLIFFRSSKRFLRDLYVSSVSPVWYFKKLLQRFCFILEKMQQSLLLPRNPDYFLFLILPRPLENIYLNLSWMYWKTLYQPPWDHRSF